MIVHTANLNVVMYAWYYMPQAATQHHCKFTYYYLASIAFVTALLGVVLIVLPGLVEKLFFDNGDSSVNFFVRMLGSTLVGYGALCFLAVRSEKIEAYKVAVWANLSTLLIATVVSLAYYNIYTGYGWLVICQHLVFTCGFLYCAWDLSKA